MSILFQKRSNKQKEKWYDSFLEEYSTQQTLRYKNWLKPMQEQKAEHINHKNFGN